MDDVDTDEYYHGYMKEYYRKYGDTEVNSYQYIENYSILEKLDKIIQLLEEIKNK